MEVNERTVGAVVSITIARAPAMLLAPVGRVVSPSGLPNASATEISVKLTTVRSDVFSPGATMYMPVSVEPGVAAVSKTTAPVSSVTSMLDPDATVFDAVATIGI